MTSQDAPRRRGELRVYLGAAPGVGKTYAALGEAHRRAERGTDVVVGLVDTRGRAKNARLLDGLEVVPRKQVTHRGHEFTEMDLDAGIDVLTEAMSGTIRAEDTPGGGLTIVISLPAA